MTLSAVYKPIVYQANGSTTTFAITWKFFDEEIIVTDGEGNRFEISKYKVYNSGNGGSIVFNEAPSSGKVIISRNVTLNQGVEFNEGENFPAEDYEYSLDRIYTILQEFADRMVKKPYDYTNSNDFVADLVKIKNLRLSKTFNYDKVYKQGELCITWKDESKVSDAIEQVSTLYLRVKGDSEIGVHPTRDTEGWREIGVTRPFVESLIKAQETALGNYYTKTEVDTQDVVYYNMVKADIDATKAEFNYKLDNLPPSVTKVSELENDAQYTTAEYIDNKIGDIDTILDDIIGEGEEDEGEDEVVNALLDTINGEIV